MDLAKVGDVVAELSRITDMELFNLAFNSIMSMMLCPKRDKHNAIEGVMRNLLVHLASKKTFDLVDFIISKLMLCASDPFIPKPFGPGIQFFVDVDLQRPYKTDSSLEYLLTPVRGPLPAPTKDKGKGIMGTSKVPSNRVRKGLQYITLLMRVLTLKCQSGGPERVR